MKKYIIYGNCQVSLISEMMELNKQFSENYQLQGVFQVHLLKQNDINILYKSIKQCDLFIYQEVSSRYEEFSSDSLLLALKNNAKKIKIPKLYFSGYNPEVEYLRDKNSNMFYHDKNLYDVFLNKKKEFFRWSELVDSEHIPTMNDSLNFIDNQFSMMQKREVDERHDIKMTDFIYENYLTDRLFYVMNHPTNRLLCELVNKVLDMMGYLGIDIPINRKLNGVIYPIYRSHYSNLNIKFDNIEYWVIHQNKYSDKEFIQYMTGKYVEIEQ